MAKSMRSKVIRAFRSKKRESGIYAATEAARLNRLNARLLKITKTDATHVAEGKGKGEGDSVGMVDSSKDQTGSMDMDTESQPPRLSTHGPRGSGREEWRKSKGMPIRPVSKGMNRQGGIAARRKAGRAKRRR